MAGSFHSRAGLRPVLLGVAFAFASAASADILVTSQNALHLGQNSKAVPNYRVGKNEFIRLDATWPGSPLPHLTFLQEVMVQAKESDIQPAGGTVYFGLLKGATSYRERYGVILVNDTANHVTILCHADTAGLVTAGSSVDRPPDATLVSDTSSGSPELVWLLSFHATFSGGLGRRRAEVAEIGRIITSLRARAPAGCPATTQNVVAMGDWNLPATDRAFTDLTRNAGFTRPVVSPNVLTSINNRTGRLSSAYDHFVWDDARVQVTLANLPAQPYCNTTARVTAGVITPVSVPTFLRHCSDHLGIVAEINVR